MFIFRGNKSLLHNSDVKLVVTEKGAYFLNFKKLVVEINGNFFSKNIFIFESKKIKIYSRITTL